MRILHIGADMSFCTTYAYWTSPTFSCSDLKLHPQFSNHQVALIIAAM